MDLQIEAETPPLERWKDGSIRIAGTRLLLETIVISYKQGDSAEEIAHNFPSASVQNVYAVIAYYLRHRDDVEAYLAEQTRRGEEVRREIEAQFPPDPGLKARLLARREKMEAERHADALR
jgi:uncharacterized protein (DUF433 family)